MAFYFTYQQFRDYIQNSEIWAANKIRVFRRDNFCCRLCDATDRPIHCHHLPEGYQCFLGQEKMEHLITICSRCHDRIHKFDKRAPVGKNLNDPVELEWNNYFSDLWAQVKAKQ